ncbi:MAG: FGGY-family carbohydrate kinase [Candidatus Geothermincolales bacterium]
MEEGELVLSYDVGTGGAKAALVTLSGEVVASDFQPYPLSYPRPHWAEQDPDDWWRAICTATRQVLARAGARPEGVVGIGFAGQMMGVVPVGADGVPLRPAIIWMDDRAEDQARRLVRKIGGPRVAMTLVGAVPSGKDVVCKLQWIREEEPQVFRDTSKFLDVTGFLVCRATGVMAMDHTAGGVTGLLNSRTRSWSRLFAGILGIPLDKLPELRACTEVVGHLREKAAAEMGLVPGIPVIAGMGDVPAAATGSGALEDGDGHYCLGTSGWLCVSVGKPVNIGKHGMVSVVSPDPEMFLLIGETETAGACLKWFADNLARPEEWEEAARKGGEMAIFEVLDRVAETVEPGAGRLLFAPWMFGERSPITDTSLRSAFVNLSLEHRREHLLRSIYEGVAFNCRWLLEVAERKGFPCRTLRAIGGGARSDLWMQILADVTGRTVEAVDSPQEAGAVGCALAVAVGLGRLKRYRDIKGTVRVRKTFSPQRENCRIYEEMYSTFKCLYQSIRGICRDLNEGEEACALDGR